MASSARHRPVTARQQCGWSLTLDSVSPGSVTFPCNPSIAPILLISHRVPLVDVDPGCQDRQKHLEPLNNSRLLCTLPIALPHSLKSNLNSQHFSTLKSELAIFHISFTLTPSVSKPLHWWLNSQAMSIPIVEAVAILQILTTTSSCIRSIASVPIQPQCGSLDLNLPKFSSSSCQLRLTHFLGPCRRPPELLQCLSSLRWIGMRDSQLTGIWTMLHLPILMSYSCFNLANSYSYQCLPLSSTQNASAPQGKWP